jgi:hypothetical protein
MFASVFIGTYRTDEVCKIPATLRFKRRFVMKHIRTSLPTLRLNYPLSGRTVC